jgi:aromatic ring-opening dioxygenase catalytic subunit (LigB family)
MLPVWGALLTVLTTVSLFHVCDSTTYTMRFPTLFVNHGGGPMPLLGDPGHANLAKFLGSVRHTMPAPKSILIVTAHWEVRGGSIPPRRREHAAHMPVPV